MNLTKMSAIFKKAVKILAIFAILYYILILGIFPSAKDFVRRLFVKEPPPNTAFGKLPPLLFVEKPLENESIAPEYELNTKNGRLPGDLPRRVYVYKYEPVRFSYLGGKNAKADASYLGFEDEDLTTDLKGNVYSWRKLGTGSTLEINIETRVLKMNTNLVFNKSDFKEGRLNVDSAKNEAKALFRRLNRLGDKYERGTQTAHLGLFMGNRILKTENPRDAQIAMVDLFRTVGQNEIKIVGPDPKRGSIRVILRAPEGISTLNYPVIQAYHWTIQEETTGVYPLLDVKDAWNAVSIGNGVISNVTPKDANPFEDYKPVRVERILINDVSVAYYETPEHQPYLQPIYVFEGNYVTRGTDGGEITIYYPAVPGEFIQ